jgi:hypothetical protein
MAQYTVDQVAELVEGSEIEADSDTEVEESDSEVDEDPDFPLPLGMTLKMRKTRGLLLLFQLHHHRVHEVRPAQIRA